MPLSETLILKNSYVGNIVGLLQEGSKLGFVVGRQEGRTIGDLEGPDKGVRDGLKVGSTGLSVGLGRLGMCVGWSLGQLHVGKNLNSGKLP